MAKIKIFAESGNAILVCACGSETDKGCPPIPGQDDSTFKCEGCQQAIDKAALAKAIETVVISGEAG